MSEKDVALRAEPDSRLAALLAEYAQVTADMAPLAERLETIKAALKFESTQAKPAAVAIQLQTTEGVPVARVARVEKWTLDSKRLKAEDLATYVRYARQSSHWEIRAVGA